MGSRPSRRGLRFKIILWSFVPTAVTLVAVGLVSFYAFQTTTRFLLIERNRELVRLNAGQLAGEMEEYADLLYSLTRSPSFIIGDASSEQEMINQAKSTLSVFDGGIYITDEQGIVVAAAPEQDGIIGADWSERSYFRQVIRTWEPHFSDIATYDPDGYWSVAVSVPVIDDQNEFRGVATGLFHLGASTISPFYGEIVKLRIGESEAAHLNTYLVDRLGRVIYHSDSQWIGKDFSVQEPVANMIQGDFQDEFADLDSGSSIYRGSAGALHGSDIYGRNVVAYYSAVPGTHWGLVSEDSWGGLLNFYRSYLYVQTFLFVLGVALPALVVGYGIRRITQPIYHLMTGARQVAQGNFGQEIQVRTGDELEELVDQFNQMSRQLSQSYAAIQEREERLALVMRGTNDGIWDWNIQTGETYFSPRWKRMLGYNEHELANEFDEWRKLIHPEDAEKAEKVIRQHLESGAELFHLEHRLQHKDGSYRWILARGTTLRDAQGNAQRMVGSHSDITERKNAEEALRQSYETLEMRVAERTSELATLNAISTLVNRSLDINKILGAALDKTLEVTGLTFGEAFRLEGEQENVWLSPEESAALGSESLYLNPMVYRGVSEKFVRFTGRLWLHGGGFRELKDFEKPVAWMVEDSAIEPELREAILEEGICQIISIPLMVKGRLVGLFVLGTSEPRAFSNEELDLLDGIGRQVGVAMENARLHEAERDRHNEAERRREVAEGLREIISVLNSRLSLGETLDLITAQARRLLDCDAVSIYRLKGSEGKLIIQSAAANDPAVELQGEIPAGAGPSGQAVATCRPVALTNRQYQWMGENPERRDLAEAERSLLSGVLDRFPALLAAPVIVREQTYGAMCLYYSQPREFAAEEIALVEAFAHQAALAVETARLYDEAQRTATLEERSRLARELHDSVTQSLYSVTLLAEAAARLLTKGEAQTAAEHLRELRDTAQEALREMRLLIFELRPLALEKNGLAEALRTRLESVEGRSGIKTDLQVEGEESLSYETKMELYQIAQETLNNILKHSHAAKVQINLSFQESQTCLEVIDDGVGFVPEQAIKSGGLGLPGMAERAQRIGGKLQIESKLEGGTRVRVVV